MSKYDSGWVEAYYDAYGDKEWHRLTRTPFDEVSLHVHTHYLEQYVQPGSRVLEIGAGAGRFTQVLANLGCRVLVADISPGQLDLNRKHGEESGFAEAVEDWVQLDVCDLGDLKSASFDAVVCYGGALSYVFERAAEAVDECTCVLRKGGAFLASVMSLWGTAHNALGGVLDIPPEENQIITDTGDLTPENYPTGHHFCHMYRAGELRDLLGRTGLEVLAMAASNCLSTRWNDLLAEIRPDTEKWAELLRIELEATREPGCLDMGTHLIAVARKLEQ
jgi:SAM-dependent methyltransferase